MRVLVNGTSREVADGTTLAALVAEAGIDPRGVAAAVNGRVVPRGEHAAVALRDGDRVELVRAVGGG